MVSPNVRDPHTPLTRGFSYCVIYGQSIMYLVEYRTPYTGEYRTQTFRCRDDAESMADFYRSCGTRATVRPAR